MSKKIRVQEEVISETNRIYKFNQVLNDFLVTDELYPLKEHGDSGRGSAYLIGICLKGKLTIELDSIVYNGSSNYMLISSPYQLFRMVEVSDDCRVRFIMFSKRFLIANDVKLEIIDKFQFSSPNAVPVIKIEKKESENIVSQYEVIWKRFREVDHPYRKEVVGSLLLVLLHDFEAIYRKHFCLLETKSTRAKV